MAPEPIALRVFEDASQCTGYSVLVGAAGAYAYIRDTLSGKTKPNRVSWSMWALAPLVATGAALASHADPWPTVRTFMGGFLPLLVFLASFANPKGYWKLTSFDLICGAFSLAAIWVWVAIDSSQLAILFAAVGDGFALFPTVRKAWQYPETETGVTFIASFLSALLVLPAIPVWNIENAAFQVYILVASAVLVGVVYRHKLGIRRKDMGCS